MQVCFPRAIVKNFILKDHGYYSNFLIHSFDLAGKAVAIAGISAGMLLLSGCSGTSTNQSSETLLSEPETPIEQVEVSDTIEEGELPMIEDSVVIKKGEIDDTEYTVVGEIIDPEQEE